MSAGFDFDGDGSSSAYEVALDAFSSLITRRTRADGSNKGDGFDVMFDYLKILELDEAISELKVIHVAGTKGKVNSNSETNPLLMVNGRALLAGQLRPRK